MATCRSTTIRLALVSGAPLVACGGDDGGAGDSATGGTTDGGPHADDSVRTIRRMVNGWLFVRDDALSDDEALASDGAGWENIRLPHSWNAANSAGDPRGLGWYRVEFETPTDGVRHWVEFGAASLVADVWMNGEKLGRHAGGFTQFRFDVTDVLAQRGSNVLLVKVDNSIPHAQDDPTAIAPLGGDFESGGLYRHVALISTAGGVHIALDDLGGPGVYASTVSVFEGTATVDVRVKLTNASAQDRDHVVRTALIDATGEAVAMVQTDGWLEAGGRGEVEQELRVSKAHLWWGVEDPYLYQLVVDLLDSSGVVIDRVVQSFGIRKIQFDSGGGLVLNGQYARLHGAGMHQDYQGRGWAVSDGDVDTSLALFTEIGANAIRLGHYPFSAYALERVSEMGLVAWAEHPSGLRTTVDPCTSIDPSGHFVANAKLQLQELIRQQYNHAAVALWSIGNETSAGQVGCDARYDNVTPYLRELHAVAKAEDPSRPTAYAEFPHPVDRSGPFATEGITDIFATNRYFLWHHEPLEEMQPLLDDLHALVSDQPLGISAYGAGSGIDHHSDNPRGGLPEAHTADGDDPSSFQPEEYASYVHEENYAVIAPTSYLWGSFVWNMFDFGSANRNEGGVLGIDTKGLVTFDRQTRKDPFFFYKANWSETPVTHIASRRYTNRAYAVTNVKVYSNGHTVELAVNGIVHGSMSRANCPFRTCVFTEVPLALGSNTVTAVGDHWGETVSDTVQWSLDTRDVNIAAGFLRTGYVSSEGARFGSDDFFLGGVGDQIESGGARGGIPQDIRGTSDPQLFKYFRRGAFAYEIPLPNGNYEVTLGWLEPDEDAKVGDRVFDVRANGASVLQRFDILERAGEVRTATTATFMVEVTRGQLLLAFEPSVGEALVSNIMITEAAR